MVKRGGKVLIQILVIGVQSNFQQIPMKAYRGFTLLELLVVLVIIGLFSGMVMLTATPNDDRILQREANRLMQVIQLSQDEAIMQGIELGLTVQADRYFFSRLQEKRWLPIVNDPHLTEHQLNDALMMTCDVGDENVVKKIDKESIIPSVMMLSSGELTGFKLSLFSLEHPDKIVQILGQENGQLSMQMSND